jgi:hypothetical protein
MLNLLYILSKSAMVGVKLETPAFWVGVTILASVGAIWLQLPTLNNIQLKNTKNI